MNTIILSANRYKLQLHDTCGSYSPLGPYHRTLHIINYSGTFTWTQQYQIEWSSNPVNTYYLLRDDLSDGSWHKVDSVVGTAWNITDPDYLLYASTASWRVEASWAIICTPTYKDTTAFTSSLSNIIFHGDVSVELSDIQNFGVYPNPFSDYFVIENLPKGRFNLEIYSLEGRLLFEKFDFEDNNERIYPHLEAGLYVVVLYNGKQMVGNKKLLVLP